jgi:hypothetical protein
MSKAAELRGSPVSIERNARSSPFRDAQIRRRRSARSRRVMASAVRANIWINRFFFCWSTPQFATVSQTANHPADRRTLAIRCGIWISS